MVRESETRGKPPKIDHENLRRVFIENRNNIVVDGKILSEKNAIWSTLSIDTKISASTLYSYALSNRYQFRSILLNHQLNSVENELDISQNSLHNSTILADHHQDSENEVQVTFAMPRNEFEMLIEEKTVLSGGKRMRVRTIMKNNIWENFIHTHLYNESKMRHGFNFTDHNLNRDATSGSIRGKN